MSKCLYQNILENDKSVFLVITKTKKRSKGALMIKFYRFKNMHSYKNDTFVDMTSGKKTAHSYFDYELNDQTKISKVIAIFGANAAGKSNLIKPLSFCGWFLTHSFKSLESSDSIPIISHVVTRDQESEIEIEFIVPSRSNNNGVKVCEDLEFKYLLRATKNRVFEEDIKIKNPTTKLYNRVINRIYNEESDKYIYKRSKLLIEEEVNILNKCPSNSSIVAFLARMTETKKETNKSPIRLIYNYFSLTQINFTIDGNKSYVDFDVINNLLKKNNDIFNKVKELLKNYDTGIDDIEFKEKEYIALTGESKSKWIPIFIHKNKGKKFNLPFWMQSSGTQSAYRILTLIVYQLIRGGVAILDEFDNDLHPLLALEILELFKNECHNISNAQLIFTSHTPQVLQALRKQHCYLVEKNDNESEAWRIDDIEGIKDRDNLYSKYISGVLGGVPNF